MSNTCFYCEFAADKVDTLNKHLLRKHKDMKEDLKARRAAILAATKAKKPPPKVKPVAEKMQQVPQDAKRQGRGLTEKEQERLTKWKELWSLRAQESTTIFDYKEVHQLCEEAYAALPSNYKFYHLICSPKVTNYGPRIYIVANVSAKCMCNILIGIEPTFEKLEELLENGVDTCHEHWLVAMETRPDDRKHRHRYMSQWFGKGNARLLPIGDKNHFLNTYLYVLGATSSNGVACHNGGRGISQETKKEIRDAIMKMDKSYRVPKAKLHRFYKKTGKPGEEEDDRLEQVRPVKIYRPDHKAKNLPPKEPEPLSGLSGMPREKAQEAIHDFMARKKAYQEELDKYWEEQKKRQEPEEPMDISTIDGNFG